MFVIFAWQTIEIQTQFLCLFLSQTLKMHKQQLATFQNHTQKQYGGSISPELLPSAANCTCP